MPKNSVHAVVPFVSFALLSLHARTHPPPLPSILLLQRLLRRGEQKKRRDASKKGVVRLRAVRVFLGRKKEAVGTTISKRCMVHGRFCFVSVPFRKKGAANRQRR